SKKKTEVLKKILAAKKTATKRNATAKKDSDKDVEIINEEAAEFVKKLKRKQGQGIVVFGGGELAKSLFEADLVDEIALNIHPVLLGSGIPLFHEMKKQIDLELLDSKILKGGYLVVTYRVKH